MGGAAGFSRATSIKCTRGARRRSTPASALRRPRPRLQARSHPDRAGTPFPTAAREHMIQFFRYCPKADSI